MAADIAYRLTRAKGKRGKVVQLIDQEFNEETGQNDDETKTTKVRWMYSEPTQYKRLVKAEAAKQDVGGTTFIMWTKDVPFVRLDPEDHIVFDDKRFEVRSSTIEFDTSFVVTADEVNPNK